MVDGGDGVPLGDLDLALVSAAHLVAEKLGVKTALVPPAGVLDIQAASEVIAKMGSPPLRVSVARDLASAGFDVIDMKPLLASTLPAGTAVSDEGLDKRRAELARRGPTVSWPGFPSGASPETHTGDAS